ncbi:MAG: class I SAM-dependent methyltransferase [Candidatus Heimdallarchaeaceae archaeon]
MTFINFDRVAEVYDLSRPVPKDLITFFKNELLSYLNERFECKIYRVLSIGIGSGRVESTLSSSTLTLFGLDISMKMLQQIRKKGYMQQHFILGNCLHLPFRSSFHLAVMIHVTHLIPNTHQLIKEIKQVCSDILVGELYTSLYENSLFKIYTSKLKELGWNKESLGLKGQEFQDSMVERGYTVVVKEKEIQTKISLNLIYSILKNQYLSSFWSVPDNYHKRAMQTLDDFIEKQDITLDSSIQVPARAVLRFFSLK